MLKRYSLIFHLGDYVKINFAVILVLVFIFAVAPVCATNIGLPVTKLTPDQTSYTPGEKVTVTADVPLISKGISTFPGTDSIRVQTDLDNPTWAYTVKVNNKGQMQTVNRQLVTISGYMLDYPNQDTVSLSIVLKGTVPSVSENSKIVLFSIEQLDGSGNTLYGSKYEWDGVVIPNKEKALAQESIDKTNAALEKTASYINDFKVNHNMGNDAQVISIEKKVESAKPSLNLANNYLASGEYDKAKRVAEVALSEASGALANAESLYEELSTGKTQTVGGDIGNYIVYSNVDGAQVYFNDDYKGVISGGELTVPVYVTGTPYTTYTVKKDGYTPFTAQITDYPTAGGTVKLHATLTPESTSTHVGGNIGNYIVYCNIDGAQVYFNNDYKGIISGGELIVSVYVTGTPYTTYLVKKDGYIPFTAQITDYPAAGEAVKLYSTLTPTHATPLSSVSIFAGLVLGILGIAYLAKRE